MAIVVLAAGGSARMGQPKQLLDLHGRPLVRKAVETALSSQGGKVRVVVGAHEGLVRDALAGLDVELISNAHWSEGMASSIRLGVQASADAGAILFMLCDQPHLSPEVLLELVTRHEAGARVAACAYDGVVGVPALFDHTLFDELLGLRGEHGAKKVVEAHRSELQTVPFPSGGVDIDTPEQYKELFS